VEFIKFQIKRYRKFEKQAIIEIEPYTVLVGSNNEGKSSVCDALELYFTFLKTNVRERQQRSFRSRSSKGIRSRYNLSRDYPLTLSGKSGRKYPSEFQGYFRLSEIELAEAKLNYSWPNNNREFIIKVSWDYKIDGLVTECDQFKDNSEKLIIFQRYFTSKIRFLAIPAIRDQDTLHHNISTLFDESIRIHLEKSKKLKGIISNLNKIILPAVENVTNQISESMKAYLTSIKKVDITWNFEVERVVNLDTIWVDDGNRTSIDLKGDGIKNLLWLGNLTHLARLGGDNTEVLRLYIIEEPEAHLNSSILYSLKQQILKLSENATVISTTHSPIFIEFSKKSSVNLISEGLITKSLDKKKIADALGIRVQENLRANSVGVIVEGDEEEIAFGILMKQFGHASKIDKIDFINATGAGNASHKYQLHKSFFEHLFVVLDNDTAGKNAGKALTNIGVNQDKIFYCPIDPGYNSSELEDIITTDFLISSLSEIYGRPLDIEIASSIKKKYKGNFKAWIVVFLNQSGMNFEDSQPIKRQLWGFLKKSNEIALTDSGKVFVNTLLSTIVEKC
jgi:predicted ATPase